MQADAALLSQVNRLFLAIFKNPSKKWGDGPVSKCKDFSSDPLSPHRKSSVCCSLFGKTFLSRGNELKKEPDEVSYREPLPLFQGDLPISLEARVFHHPFPLGRRTNRRGGETLHKISLEKVTSQRKERVGMWNCKY